MNNFTHINAKTVAEAASALGSGKAAVIAGGTDLLTTLKDFINPTQPETLVNIKTIPGLDYIKEEGGMLKIGALTRLADIAESAVVQAKWPSLATAAHKVGTPQLRNAGTIGGNLCQECRCWYYRGANNYFFCFKKGGTICLAVPGDNTYNAILGGQVCFAVCPSDTAIPLSALNASIVTNKGTKPIADLFVVLGDTLAKDEIITEIQVPAPAAGTKQSFLKFSHRKSWDFAVASAAVAITVAGGTVSDCRIVLGGVSPIPYRATDAEAALKGKAIDDASATAAGAGAVAKAMALPKNKWLIQETKTIVKRAILAAV
jgi:xanthine dehydrogenase YagS FAD-binding subunit